MRTPRRGVIAQKKGGGYVWAVYSLAPGIDESVYTTGSFTMTKSLLGSAPTLMAADGYTVSSNGTISLTSAVSTSVANLAAGKYIVSISSSSSTTTTSTQYLYKVTGVTSSGTITVTYTVSYERYEVEHNAKGEDTGERVNSTTQDYPVDGLHTDGRWYVMLKGTYTAYVWDVYNINDAGWQAVSSTPDRDTNPPIGVANTSSSGGYDYTSTAYYTKSANNITITADGYATGFDTSLKTNTSNWTDALGGLTYYVPKANNNRYYYYGATSSIVGMSVRAQRRYDVKKKYTQGTSTGVTVESSDESKYPSNGIQGNYWYVYSHSYEKTIDNT